MKKSNNNIGFIGAGNMGYAMISAIIGSNLYKPSDISVSDINIESIKNIKKTFNIVSENSNIELFLSCGIIILAVKPQHLINCLSQIVNNKKFKEVNEKKLIISIAAGITIKQIESVLYEKIDLNTQKKLPVIRVMPNTPALVLSAMSGISKNVYVTDRDLKNAKNILKSMGKVIEFEEKQLNAVTAMSGSGPAYLFYLAESMIEAGLALELDPKESVALTIETLKGAIKLLENSSDSPFQLRKKVTSPGGTTEAAFNVFEKYSTKKVIIEAICAAEKRSVELCS